MKQADKLKLTNAGHNIDEIDIIDKFMKATGRGMDNALEWLDLPKLIDIARQEAIAAAYESAHALEEYEQQQVIDRLTTPDTRTPLAKLVKHGITLKYEAKRCSDNTSEFNIRQATFNAIRYFVTKKVITPISEEAWLELHKRVN